MTTKEAGFVNLLARAGQGLFRTAQQTGRTLGKVPTGRQFRDAPLKHTIRSAVLPHFGKYNRPIRTGLMAAGVGAGAMALNNSVQSRSRFAGVARDMMDQIAQQQPDLSRQNSFYDYLGDAAKRPYGNLYDSLTRRTPATQEQYGDSERQDFWNRRVGNFLKAGPVDFFKALRMPAYVPLKTGWNWWRGDDSSKSTNIRYGVASRW